MSTSIDSITKIDEKVDAKTVAGFTVSHLFAEYDNPKPIPPFHLEMWEMCCSESPNVAIAAPRKHAKSSAITYAYILAMMLTRQKCFCLLVSNTESQASEFLMSIKSELETNDALRERYGIREFVTDTQTNIIVQMSDGHQFRIQAKGSEQKVRGLKWINKRPDLIVCDDLEEDEQVMSRERREKFLHWFMNALIPCGSDNCWVRVVGTILHLDSMLQRLLDDPTWKSLKFEAHNSDWSEILWPEKFSKEELLRIRAGFEAQGNLDGWSQEYLNRPIATGNAFFNPDYFYDFERDKNDRWIKPNLEYYAAADFAISEKEKADYTAIVVAGMSPDGMLYIVDAKKGRWDSDQIIEELLATQRHYNPVLFTFETEKIDKAIGPFLNREMRKQNTYLNIKTMVPGKSKTARAASIQGMHKSGSIRYDHEASWYPDFRGELLTVSDSGPRGRHDDWFDAFAYIGKSIDEYYEAFSDAEIEEEEHQDLLESYYRQGVCKTTGY